MFSMTVTLIFLNVVFFILAYITSFFFPVMDYLALKPSAIVQGKHFWTLLSSMFMHAGFFHLFFNMLSLFFVGVFIERIIGRKRFLWFYLISGIFAGLFFAVLSGFFGQTYLGEKIFGNPEIMGVGASGALFGLVGLLAVLVPFSKVYLILGPLLAIIISSLSSKLFSGNALNIVDFLISMYIVLSIFVIFSFNSKMRKIALPVEMPLWLLPIVAIIPLIIIGLFIPLPIGNIAHLGGLLAGLVYGFYLRNKYKNKVKHLSKYF